MNFTNALIQTIRHDDYPIITTYDLFKIGYTLFQAKNYNGETLVRVPTEWSISQVQKRAQRLVRRKVLIPDEDFRSGVWRVAQSSRAGAAEEIACMVDPFCYVSHLSAMQRYGLTNRNPSSLHLTRPDQKQWTKMRDSKLASELNGSYEEHHPPLVRHGFKQTIRRRQIAMHETRHPDTPFQLRGEQTRISSVGRVFLEMLIDPPLCGGMPHVIEIWKKHAKAYLEQIIERIDGATEPIAKVRAGYLLTERIGLRHPKIDVWKHYASRGGSRKLDPEQPYAPRYSEEWMLSINA